MDAPYRTAVVVLPGGRVVTRPAQYNPENLSGDQAERLIDRLLPMWTADTTFLVDQLEGLNSEQGGRFTGRLDLDHLGIFGHSFGGATALQFCHDDPRCKAGIDLDGAPHGSVIEDGLKQPFMFLLSDHSREEQDPEARKVHHNLQSIYDHLPGGRLYIVIEGANHFSFTDQIVLKSQYLIGAMHRVGLVRLDGQRGLGITAEYVHTFFDVYLKGAPANLLLDLSTRYPEAKAGL